MFSVNKNMCTNSNSILYYIYILYCIFIRLLAVIYKKALFIFPLYDVYQYVCKEQADLPIFFVCRHISKCTFFIIIFVRFFFYPIFFYFSSCITCLEDAVIHLQMQTIRRLTKKLQKTLFCLRKMLLDTFFIRKRAFRLSLSLSPRCPN